MNKAISNEEQFHQDSYSLASCFMEDFAREYWDPRRRIMDPMDFALFR